MILESSVTDGYIDGGIHLNLYACIIWHHFVQTMTCISTARSSSSHMCSLGPYLTETPEYRPIGTNCEEKMTFLFLRSVVHQ